MQSRSSACVMKHACMLACGPFDRSSSWPCDIAPGTQIYVHMYMHAYALAASGLIHAGIRTSACGSSHMYTCTCMHSCRCGKVCMPGHRFGDSRRHPSCIGYLIYLRVAVCAALFEITGWACMHPWAQHSFACRSFSCGGAIFL